MKLKNAYVKTFCFISLLFVINACQDNDEINEFVEIELIEANSELSNLILAVTSFDGSYDNIIDGSSCLSVKLPVSLIVNGNNITVNSEDDYQTIEDIFDEIVDNIDVLEIIFPVTLILSDHSEVIVNDNQNMEQFTGFCIEGGMDDDNECIDFIYPISMLQPNSETNTLIINDDKSLFQFINEINNGLNYGIDYPIELQLNDELVTQVSNNTELVGMINSNNNCDEDDDNNFNDDDFTVEDLSTILISSNWVIEKVISNGEDLMEVRGFILSFNDDGTAIADTNGGDDFGGDWDLRLTNNGTIITLNFDGYQDVFNQEWAAFDIGGGRIKFLSEEGDRVIMKEEL